MTDWQANLSFSSVELSDSELEDAGLGRQVGNLFLLIVFFSCQPPILTRWLDKTRSLLPWRPRSPPRWLVVASPLLRGSG